MKNIYITLLLCFINSFILKSQIIDNIQIENSKPNIIFILIDDMGYGDLSSYGSHKIETPHMDRIGKEGISFRNFYVGSPICSPSRVTFTTGQYPARHQITSFLAGSELNEKRGMRNYLNPEAPSIARIMKDAGYATAHFGKWHMGGGRDVGDAPTPHAYGFDESLVSFEGLGDRLLIKGDRLSEESGKLENGKITWVAKHEQTPIYVDKTLDFIKLNKRRPFYIHLWFNDVHDPFDAKEEILKKFSYYGNNHYEQKFLATLYQLDKEVGRLLDGLDEFDLTRNTLVVLTSDNGPTDWAFYYKQYFAPPGSEGPFRGRKWSLYEGGIRAPFMARWPAKIPPGKVNEGTVFHAVDYFPTMCKIVGIEISQNEVFDGEVMYEAMMGNSHKRTKPLFWQYGSEHDIKPGNPRFISPRLAMRDGHWKLLVNEDGSSAELYNVLQDNIEANNVAEENADILKVMTERVQQWWKKMP